MFQVILHLFMDIEETSAVDCRAALCRRIRAIHGGDSTATGGTIGVARCYYMYLQGSYGRGNLVFYEFSVVGNISQISNYP